MVLLPGLFETEPAGEATREPNSANTTAKAIEITVSETV